DRRGREGPGRPPAPALAEGPANRIHRRLVAQAPPHRRPQARDRRRRGVHRLGCRLRRAPCPARARTRGTVERDVPREEGRRDREGGGRNLLQDTGPRSLKLVLLIELRAREIVALAETADDEDLAAREQRRCMEFPRRDERTRDREGPGGRVEQLRARQILESAEATRDEHLAVRKQRRRSIEPRRRQRARVREVP